MEFVQSHPPCETNFNDDINKDIRKLKSTTRFNGATSLLEEHFLEDDVFHEYETNGKNVVDRLFSPVQDTRDKVSVVNSEVVLRNPSSAYRSPLHSNSSIDLRMFRNTQQPSRGNLKTSRSMILPVAPGSRPRSLYSVSSFNNSPPYQDLDVLEQFASHIPPEEGGRTSNSIIYCNNGFDTKMYQNRRYMMPAGELDKAKPQQQSPEIHSSAPTPNFSALTETKRKIFADILAISLSTIYAILIITLGISFYIVDSLQLANEGVQYIAEGFSLVLLCVALLYLLYINFDITIYNNKKRKFEKLMETIQPEHIEMKETSEGVLYDITLHEAFDLRRKLDHRYCFSMDRHSSNFYLKVGAAGFCFGHLIHSFLILTYRGVVLSSDDQYDNECNSLITFIIEILYPIYSVLLLFFIFKYSNVIINKNRGFHRFGFMHCLGSSLCFWLWTIFRETAEYIQNSDYPQDYNNTEQDLELKPKIITRDTNSLLAYSRMRNSRKLQIIKPYRFTAICEHNDMNIIYQNYSPYLYPFSVEYSILVVGIIYIVWVNVGLCNSDDSEHEYNHQQEIRKCRNDRKMSEPESNLAVHADCHASNKGLFGGFIVFVFAIVSVILFFIMYYNDSAKLAQTGLVQIQSTRVVIIVLMIVAVLFAYYQIIKLDINEAAHNSLDTFLCLMCLPAFFIHGIFSVIPGITSGNILASIGIILETIQIVIQTLLIVDGMSRSSNSKTLRKKKLGREFVTFLIICNVAMWIMQTFEVKSHGLDQYRQEFYSRELWSIVGHMCLPLMMFYRFHSSVCLGDIWKYAYMSSGY